MTTGEDAAPTGSTAVDAAIARMRAVAAETGAAGPGDAGSADADVLRTALATLPYQEQRLLWDSHVLGRGLDGVAGALGLHVRAARRRLTRAEEQLARALSAAHARGVPARLCVETRGDLHAYVGHRLGGGRRTALEDHLFGCSGCLRAFVDVREASWALRDAAPLLLAPLAGGGTGVPVVVGALGTGPATGVAGWFAAVGAALTAAWERLLRTLGRTTGRPVGLAAGAAASLVAVAAVAMSLAPGPDPAPAGAVVAPSTSPVPLPATTDTPDVPATPTATLSDEPSASAEATPEPEPSDPADADEPSEPTVDVEPAPDTTADPGDQPTATEPTATEEPVEPRPSPTGTPGGTAPTTSPTPQATPTPTAAPDPVDPAPEPPGTVEATVTLWVGGYGWYRVVPTGGSQVVDVGGHRVEVTQDGDGRWWVRSQGGRDRDVTVVLSGPAGTTPGAWLSWYGLDG